MAQELAGLAQPSAHGGQEVDGRGRVLLQEPMDVAPIHAQGLEVLGNHHRSRARAAVEERHLAEEVPGPRGLEDDALPGVVLHEHLDRAGAR